MRAWQEDQLQALCAVECEHALFEMIVSLAHDLGFDHCCYGLRMPLPLTQPKTVMFNNYPIGWEERYQEKIILPSTQRCSMACARYYPSSGQIAYLPQHQNFGKTRVHLDCKLAGPRLVEM